MKVYAVIVIFNGLKWIDKCLGSLLSSQMGVGLIVIDNGSTDGSIDKIEKDYAQSVRFIKSGANLGFGKANNIGMQIALEEGADYVFLLNQDAWVEQDTIGTLVDVAERNKGYGIVSPVHLNGSYTGLDYNFSLNITPEKCPGFYSDTFVGKHADIYPLEFVNAAAWLISRACLQKTGLFNPAFFFYGEDNNYLQRVKFYGFGIGITPACTICHDREQRKGKLNFKSLKLKERTQSLIILLNINSSFPRAILSFMKERIIGIIRSIFKKEARMAGYHFGEIAFLITHGRMLRKNRQAYSRPFS